MLKDRNIGNWEKENYALCLTSILFPVFMHMKIAFRRLFSNALAVSHQGMDTDEKAFFSWKYL